MEMMIDNALLGAKSSGINCKGQNIKKIHKGGKTKTRVYKAPLETRKMNSIEFQNRDFHNTSLDQLDINYDSSPSTKKHPNDNYAQDSTKCKTKPQMLYKKCKKLENVRFYEKKVKNCLVTYIYIFRSSYF